MVSGEKWNRRKGFFVVMNVEKKVASTYLPFYVKTPLLKGVQKNEAA